MVRLLLLLLLCSAVVASAVVGRTSPPLSSEKGKGFLQCKVCEQSLSKVEQLVASEAVQNKVVDVLVNDVCPKTPEVEKCQQYAKAGVPMAAQYITAHFAPDTTCTDLKLCSKTMAAQVAKTVGASNETCSFCKAAVGFIDEKFVQNKTSAEVVDEMKAGCDKLAAFNAGLGDQCTKYVDEYGSKISFVLTTLGPDQLCGFVHACETDVDLTHPVVSPVFSAAVAESVQLHPAYVSGGEVVNEGECGECKFVVTQVKNVLSSNSTQQKIVGIVEKLCGDLPGGMAGECTSLVDAYGPMVLSTVADKLDPEEDCKNIGACSSGKDVLVLPGGSVGAGVEHA